MICGTCGTENAAGTKFCDNCGSGLVSGCPTCGSTNRPSARYCAQCGAPLPDGATEAAAPLAASERVAERRLVTVLFADLVGFTPFAEERDAEEVRETLSRYFELASNVMGRYGGSVEKFIGDAVMAVWGAPIAHEDDAERAVRAALDLVDAVRILGPDIQARAGVLTGEAAVTLGATNQGMVAGDLVNTASRLQSVAPPGSVLVGEATHRAANLAIAFEDAGEQILKGKAAPVPAWRATRIVAEVGGKNRSEGLEAPFVGRDDELRLLKDLFLATGRERKIRLVSVVGPAGIGKSRLAWEFRKYVDGLVETTYWHSGRSPAYGEGITFWALGEMVRERCGLVEADDEATTRAKVAVSVREYISDLSEQAWVESALLSLLGIESRAATEQLFAAWRTYFERIAARALVVLVFEDLHFADSGTLDFIDHLQEWSKGLPVMVITLARPELLERRSDWGAGKRSFTSLYLEPLPEGAMRQLLAGLVPGLPRSAATAIVGRADGIPLYAVETVRMLLAEGRLHEDGGAYVPAGDLGEIAVPETLTALIAARLDALDPPDRALIQDAAVLGQSFTVAGLVALSRIEPSTIDERLQRLMRRELIMRDSDPRSPEQGQFAFVQAFIREVAYNTLTRVDRKTRHLSAARFFESLGSGELAGALASHYLAAHATAVPGPEADALAAQARVALQGAADRASSLGAHDQAVAFLEQALTVTTDAGERGELLERAGRSAVTGAQLQKAEILLSEAIRINSDQGNAASLARALVAQAEVLLQTRNPGEAVDLLEPAVTGSLTDLTSDPAVVELHAAYLMALSQTETLAKVIAAAEPVLTSAEHQDHPNALALALTAKGHALGMLGRLREAIGVLRAAEEVARDAGLTATHAGAIHARTFWQANVDYRGAQLGLQEGLALAARAGDRARAFRLSGNLGFYLFLTGEWDAAMVVLNEALEAEPEDTFRLSLLVNALDIRASRGEQLDREFDELAALVAHSPSQDNYQAVACDAIGHRAAAQGHFGAARETFLEMVRIDASQAPTVHGFTGRLALWEGDRAAAASDLAALDATGIRGGVIEARRGAIQAGILAVDGKITEAVARYRAVIALFEQQGLGWEATLARLDAVLLIGPSEAAVQAMGAEARAFLVHLGAQPYVAMLDAALAGAPTAAAPQRRGMAEAPLNR